MNRIDPGSAPKGIPIRGKIDIHSDDSVVNGVTKDAPGLGLIGAIRTKEVSIAPIGREA